MALVLSHAGPLKPEVRLGQTIKEFEVALSEEQKAAFEAGRNHALSSPPIMRDVMQLTAEVDRQVRAKNKGGYRCFGPRLTKILESVQQFVSVGDIIIGGSQNLIACGVWSIVRLTLLTATRFSVYLDKLSSLFMMAGQSAPRYQEMVALHPRSKALRSLGLEYYIVVVRLCHQVVSICNKSTLGQLKAFFQDLDITAYQSELLRHSNAIKEQLCLEEAREDASARSVLSKLSSQELHRRRVEKKMKFLRNCSTFNYQSAWKQARKCGNATWFLREEVYRDWKQKASSSTLLVEGKLGAGKTVLLANMIDDLNLNTTGHIITYFFCQPDHTESQAYRTIIGCLARQVLESLELGNLDQPWIQPDSEMDDDATEAIFAIEAIKNRQIYIVLDGIDDCNASVRARLIKFLQSLRTHLHTKLCISLRLTADSRIQTELATLAPDSIMEMPTVNPDIKDFIQARLETCLENGELAIGEPALIIAIQEALENGAQGMFLWVVLQIQTLCAQRTDQDIRIALQELPNDLPETFYRILLKARGLGSQYQDRLLDLIVAALRPLSTDELREALSVDPMSSVWDPSRMVNSVNAVLATCGSLLIVDEELSTVHFIHSSVKQFLLGHFGDNKGFGSGLEAANVEMARIVVTYLHYDIFSTQISTRVASSIPANQVPQSIISSTMSSSNLPSSIALRLLKLRKAPDFDLDSDGAFPFTLNAPECWAIDNSHYGIFQSQIRNARSGILSVCRAAAYLRYRGYEDSPNFQPEFCLTLLTLAAEFRYYGICHRLLNRCASEMKWSDILDVVLKKGACPTVIALILIQAQKRDGACSPALLSDMFAPLRGTILRNVYISPSQGLKIGDEVTMLPQRQSQYDINVWKVSRGARDFIISADVVAWTDAKYISCCRYHVGIVVGRDRLCACCVPERYRPVVEELGNLNAVTDLDGLRTLRIRYTTSQFRFQLGIGLDAEPRHIPPRNSCPPIGGELKRSYAWGLSIVRENHDSEDIAQPI
ncbi:hypothetical protein Hte_012295 [Hypoxylon texense]